MKFNAITNIRQPISERHTKEACKFLWMEKKRKKQNYYCNNKAAYTVICMQHLKFIFRNCNQCTTRPITSKLKQSSISQTKTKQTNKQRISRLSIQHEYKSFKTNIVL